MKLEWIKNLIENRKLWRRVLSFVLVLALAVNTLYSGGLLGLPIFSTVMTAEAEEPSYTPTNPASSFSGTEFSFSNDESGMRKFVDYCYYYSTNEGDTFCDAHKGDKLSIVFVDLPDTYGFMGLGNATTPFAGRITFIAQGGASNISLPRALFTHVSTDARLTDNELVPNDITLEITKNSSASSPLLADYVHQGTGAATWKIKVPSSNTNAFAGVIGQIMTGASVSLVFENASSAAISNTASGSGDVKDVGELCGVMKTGSSLTVTDATSTRTEVSSSNGNAGSLVGTMEGTASLTLDSGYPGFSDLSVTSGNGYAGGLVGDMASSATITFTGLSSPLSVGGAVTGTTGAGGLYGHYTNSAATFDLKDYNITAAVSANNCGGVFGVLENNGGGSVVALTIKNTGSGTLMAESGTTSNTSGYFGGIAGKYTTDARTNSLILDGLTLTANAYAAFNAFGGAIGIVDSAAFVQTSNTMSVTATGTTDSSYFGGLVGATSADNGVFVNLGSFTLNTGSEEFKGGGVVGLFNKGVLRISGTTTMTNAKPASAGNCGQLVGKNDNVLVYTPGSWTFTRSSGALTDDLGTWGEVVRIANIETNILTFDSTAHTVTVAAAVLAMSTQNHLVINALNMQLDSCGCLVMPSTRSAMYSTDLSLDASVSFTGTGITGLMRDGGVVSSIGCYTGTFNGNDYTITLAIGEKYGDGITASSTVEGIGQIYRHQHNGLFSSLAGTVQNLTVDGTINVSNCVAGMNIGGIASRNGGNVTLTKVVANEVINYNESSNVSVDTTAEGKNIGGYIGFVGTNGNITINGVSSIGATFNLSGHHESWNVYGGAIGKVIASTFNISIGTANDSANKLTVGMVADVSGITDVAANSDCGGLIGHITDVGSFGSRTVNINNLIFDDVTVGDTTKTPTIGNAANTNAGGFLGYSWLNSTVNINGLTVTKGNINNCTTNGTAGGNVNVGVMCYKATGIWNVDKLTVTNMTMANGGETSVGMLVNKAYNGTDGLYLNVLNTGYTLTAATLPSLSKYDELAAYSAENAAGVLAGGAGVISINMNADRATANATVTSTGTYQNQLSVTSTQTSNYANDTARYYYNLDKMSNSDAAQNIMLWSVNQYAADNIKGEFVSLGAPFACESETTVSLASYSYYPVYSVSSMTLSNINIAFGYNGIYTAESTFDSDSYNRDPGAQNQHYLMQSGLFINGAEGSTLTLNTVKLSGDFLENSTYQGVLFSGTTHGSISVNGLILDGITPKYNNAGTISNYNTGYLLVKKVEREDAFKANVQINLSNISTSAAYTSNDATATVAKSLFGDVYGPAIGINIEDVKLDARSANGGLSALDTAYGTKNSIFTTATFFNSIKTSQAATMIYNYELSDDWPTSRNVTYGQEVSQSVEYAGRETKYYNDTTHYTDPTTGSNTTGPYDFSAWRPYVAQAYSANQTQDANGCFYREIKVNVAAVAYAEGCGTYNDPYIIDSGDKLTAIAALINSPGTNNANAANLASLQLPKTLYDGLVANTTGARWCDANADHAVYNWNGTDYRSTESGTAVWSVENVRLYLANAYYFLAASSDDSSGNIVLGNGYLGLGGTDASGKYAFRGVIFGDGRTIVNNSQKTLVNVSNGCVLKNLTVNQNVDVSLTEQTSAACNGAHFGYTSACQYYGGLIGEIMGGDNIIDNSYVTYGSHTVTLKGSYGTIVPVGGYVGVIVFGGLIFKNMDESKTTLAQTGLCVYYTGEDYNLADNSDQEAWAAIYVNPIVGRVINGYAVNETARFSVTEDGTYHDEDGSSRTAPDGSALNQHTLKNGKKHYSIADINKNETNKLSVPTVSGSSDGTINIPNAQAFFILSLITQSCAGTANSSTGNYNTSLSYGIYSNNVYGMSHIADYSHVGSASSTSDSDYILASKDTAGNTASTNYSIPYIIYHYTADTVGDKTGTFPARCVTSTSGYYNINLTAKTTYSVSSYTYHLPDSFRGLGSVGNYDNNDTLKMNLFSMKVDVFNGNGCTIDEDIYLNKFKTDNYFDVMHQGKDQAVNLNTKAYSANTNADNHGIGLFDSIISKDDTNEIGNFILTGSVDTEMYSNTYKTSGQEEVFVASGAKSSWLSVSGVIGWSKGAGNNKAEQQQGLSFNKITLDNLTLCGDDFVGGLLAYSGMRSKAKKVIITECSANNISVKMSSAYYGDSDSKKARNSIGCFVGKVHEGAVIVYGTSQKENNSDITKFSTVKIGAYGFGVSNGDYRVAVGGLVGYAGNGCQAYDMKICLYDSAVTIGLNSGTSYVGGIVGAMQPSTDGDTDCLAVFKNCTVENINIAGQYAGGLYGGKWTYQNYNPYKIEIRNCSLIGNETHHNTIYSQKYAGGFIAWAIVQTRNGNDYNIQISDSTVSNYKISSVASGYSGGFIGYCQANNQSITCYIHDSSVENCEIGLGGGSNKDYAGGIIGGVNKHADNRILGYNIKLDNVSSPNTNRKGTWIGAVSTDSSNKTYIQFSGMAVYGERYDFTQNVGSGSADASFVFADYSGASKTFVTTNTSSDSVAKQEGDVDSETEAFTVNSTAKTVSRVVTTVTVGDTVTTTETQTTVYPYISASTADPVSDPSLTESSNVWAVHEDTGTITNTVSDASTHTVTVTTYNLAVSDYNRTGSNSVLMPKYPYVNVNPQSDMGTDKIISGDGAVLYTPSTPDSYIDNYSYTDSDSETQYYPAAHTMAAKIYADLSDTSNKRRYTTFKAFNDTDGAKISGNNTINDYMLRTTDSDGDRISTYLDEKGELPSGVENFAVVVIANNETTETTNLINRYIQLVTNTATDYTDPSEYYSIVVKNCSYSGGKFVTDNTTPGLTWTAPAGDDKGTFALNGASADSKRENTFTLVDVQFKDPFDTDKIAYHLYIPVYTIKEMEITFSAAVMNGTNSASYDGGTESNPYATKLAKTDADYHVDNMNSWFTTYIRYTYSHDDLQALLDSGNLNWNHEKYFYLEKMSNTSMLPTSTYMILVDPNGNQDKKYQVLLTNDDFARAGSTAKITFDLTKFTSGNSNFSVCTYNELIAQKLTAAASANGKYDRYTGSVPPSNTGDTHYVYVKAADGTPTYYQYVGSGGGYDLTLAAGDVYENYYISMYVPGAVNDTSLYGYYIRTPDSFEAPIYASGTNNAITKSAKVNCHYGVNANATTVNRQVYIGNLFTQETELTVLPNDLEIDNGNHTLNIYAKTTIRPRDANVTTILNAVNADIYHSFNVFLDRKGENGQITNTISGLIHDLENNQTTDIQAWYRIGTAIPTGEDAVMSAQGIIEINPGNIDLQSSYINITTVNGGQTVLNSSGVTIYSRIRLDFSDYASEFPQKVANDTGVSVRAASNLAYDQASLAFSNMSEPLEEPTDTKHIFYRQSLNTASMNYYAETELDRFDTDGTQSENYSRLGVSGRYSMNTYMPIDTTARYNVQNIDSALPDADSLILTLSLQKKTDSPAGGPYTAASYQNVSPISNYWGSVQRDGSYEVVPNASGAPVTVSGTNLHIQCGNYDQLVTVASNAATITLTIPKDASGTPGYTVDENGYIYIHIGFNAKTGAEFTEYANYKVNLSVKLSSIATGDITGSYADDYLIYTNAKVNHDFLRIS